jgi:hypothetical protein
MDQKLIREGSVSLPAVPLGPPTDPYNWYAYPWPSQIGAWQGVINGPPPSLTKEYKVWFFEEDFVRIKEQFVYADTADFKENYLCFYKAGRLIAAFNRWERFELVEPSQAPADVVESV